MNQSYVASGSRQPVVLTAIVGLHVLAFIVIAAGLGPRMIQKAKDPPPILWPEPEKPEPRIAEPDPTDPVEPYADPVVKPDIFIPPFADAEDERNVVAEATETSGSDVGAAMDPVVVVAPRRRTQDSRLAALINACYPAASRRNNEEGRLVARITIGANGSPSAWSVTQSSGFARLDQAAGCVIRRIEFIAGRQDGRAVAADAELPIAFQLD